ncbi:Glyoxylate/succinic semialdehyde reductase 2 [Hibiscus syriacus]|uniref:Glyoxylate/succinic semialdehyde reductase 2 n=1 Tax=Hibiscus syriacus TaxID=106335 RepID=A0A6A2YYU8_HIBSY|nr:Glyoxylate/succinic semialdehyde reductase 2 [Hibiscus syriacus]
MEIGFLGLGIMGKAMSMNLLKNGFKVTVWNRTLSKCNELLAHGASVGQTPAEVGKGYIDMSTVDPETSCKISEAIMSKGGQFLEAPVSGSKQPAETGQLVILAAGEKALYDAAVPAFDILGKKSFFLGEVGNGAKMKLVVNMIMGSMMNAFSEGLVLADRSGLNPNDLLDVLDLGAIANPMFKGKGPAMLQNNYSPAFPLKHQQKDMRLALALGDENAVPMPVAAAANEAFKKARSMRLGDLDFSAVSETLKDLKHST